MLAATSGQGSEAGHEKVKPREGNHVDRQLSKISVQLSRESKAGGNSRHGEGYKMVEVSISRCGKLQGSKIKDILIVLKIKYELNNLSRKFIEILS